MRRRVIELLVGLGVALAVLMPRLAPAQTPVLPGLLLAPAAPGQLSQFAPYSSANPLAITCISGCSGGGSAGAVYGPTVAGSPAANPPVLMGGTIDGTSTGNVDNWKVVGGVGYANMAQMGGTAINSGCVSNFGTAPGAVACPSFNAFVTNTATQVTPGNGISAPTGTSPSVSSPVTAFLEMYNGTTWDAAQDDANKMLKTAPTCTGNSIPINQTSSTDVHTFTGYGYICSIVLISGTQQSISISEGTGSTCATGTAYLLGGSGGTMALAQYGGISSVSGVPWLKLKNSADHLCVLQSSTGNVSGTITFADLTN